jgi:hypothetical protein
MQWPERPRPKTSHQSFSVSIRVFTSTRVLDRPDNPKPEERAGAIDSLAGFASQWLSSQAPTRLRPTRIKMIFLALHQPTRDLQLGGRAVGNLKPAGRETPRGVALGAIGRSPSQTLNVSVDVSPNPVLTCLRTLYTLACHKACLHNDLPARMCFASASLGTRRTLPNALQTDRRHN